MTTHAAALARYESEDLILTGVCFIYVQYIKPKIRAPAPAESGGERIKQIRSPVVAGA